MLDLYIEFDSNIKLFGAYLLILFPKLFMYIFFYPWCVLLTLYVLKFVFYAIFSAINMLYEYLDSLDSFQINLYKIFSHIIWFSKYLSLIGYAFKSFSDIVIFIDSNMKLNKKLKTYVVYLFWIFYLLSFC